MTDLPENTPVYLASIALEPNRWKPADRKVPSLRVSDWSARAHQAGFAGWELWEHHWFLADPDERAALAESLCPIRIFNTYLIPGIDSPAQWDRVVEAVNTLGSQVHGIKFNLGKDSVPLDSQIQAAMDWATQLPPAVRMLCECHPGTVLETPQAAAKAFAIWPAARFGAILHPMGRDPGHCDAWFSALNGRIQHLHWQARDDDNRICALRDQPDLLSVVKNSLQENAFRGTQSVEFVHGTGRADESIAGLFAEATQDLSSLLSLYRG
jgi:hypothetical protein